MKIIMIINTVSITGFGSGDDREGCISPAGHGPGRQAGRGGRAGESDLVYTLLIRVEAPSVGKGSDGGGSGPSCSPLSPIHSDANAY